MESALTRACPRCQRQTAAPFATGGVCLRCAGERALALDLDIAEPAAAPDAVPSRPPFAAHLPERIGPYEIIDELGRGGMAHVYIARQPRLDRLVALKVLAENSTTSDLVQRFLREAQTVARLRHPHIVALHDSGRADGFVYFAMDLIEGGDLARRLRTGPLPARPAAVLAQKIAGALAHAHGAGILHRDLKPSNILLDGDEPLLADFGLAAQLEPGGDLTSVSTILGTPHYLAPEAIHAGSAALSPASDVYALGVVLYEMLAGRAPFAGATAAELPSLLENSDPPPLRLLAPATPRDLVVIALQCLQREPARRYATAAALAEDLQRFLAGEPILARPPDAWTRFRRFSRRHRTLIAVAAGTGLALTGGIAVSTYLAVRERQARKEAATEAATARALVEFFQQDLLLQAKPENQADRDLKLRTALDAASARIGTRFTQQPLVEAALRATLAEALHSLGEYAAAAAQYASAIALRRRELPDDETTWRLLSSQAFALSQASRHSEALAVLTPTLTAQRGALGPDHRDTLASERRLAAIWDAQDRLADSLRLRRDLLARHARLDGPDAPETLEARNNVATSLLNLGQFPEARELLQQTYEKRRQLLGAEAAPTLESLNDLAGANWALGRLAEAEAHFRVAVPLTRRVLGQTHPDALRTLANLGHVLAAQSRLAEAAGTFEDALTQLRTALGPGHQEVLRVSGALAAVYSQEGYLERAESLCQEVIEACSKSLGEKHPEVLALRTQLGGILVADQKYADAEKELRDTLADHQTLDERRPVQFVAQSHLGAALVGLGRYAEAEEHLLAAQKGFEVLAAQLTPRQQAVRRQTNERLATLYRAWQKPELAREWEARANAKP